ncbi:MAG: hypothetical protein IJP03_05990 [Christensenellaceae bacterium]|nr:hypothetical protein [Christensenellaceae bacterium]
MRDTLDRLLADALADENLRSTLLATRGGSTPMSEFCRVATELGYPLTVAGLFTMGTEDAGNLMKSTNGGCPNPFDEFEDPYEMFFAALEK